MGWTLSRHWEGLGKPWAVHLMGEEGRVPQSCSLTLRNRNPNQIVRLHFMHQNWPKGVIETSIWDIECSNSSKIPQIALILVIFSNICATKEASLSINRVSMCSRSWNKWLYSILYGFCSISSHKISKNNVFHRQTVFFYEIFKSHKIRDFIESFSNWRASLNACQKQYYIWEIIFWDVQDSIDGSS